MSYSGIDPQGIQLVGYLTYPGIFPGCIFWSAYTDLLSVTFYLSNLKQGVFIKGKLVSNSFFEGMCSNREPVFFL